MLFGDKVTIEWGLFFVFALVLIVLPMVVLCVVKKQDKPLWIAAAGFVCMAPIFFLYTYTDLMWISLFLAIFIWACGVIASIRKNKE